MLHFAKDVDSAIRQVKKEFEQCCIITGWHKDDLSEGGVELDGAHLLERSTFPELRCCLENIYPINRRHHSDRTQECLDYMTYKDTQGFTVSRNRKSLEHIEWILTYVHDNHRETVTARLLVLLQGILAEVKDEKAKSIARDGLLIIESHFH